MKSFADYLSEGSHSFKDFKDPWAIMSPEDRKEANRLTILILKAFRPVGSHMGQPDSSD